MENTMYFLFAGNDDSYTGGGMGDYVGTFPTIEEARRKAITFIHAGEDWYQIAQLVDNKLVVVETWKP